jgi:transposase
MGRRSFSREFKLEAVRLVRERGVSVAQAARDLDLHQNMLRNWVRDFAADPAQAFPGQGQMKPEQARSSGSGAKCRSSRPSATS